MQRYGLTFEVIWRDDDIIELSILAESRRFRGQADVYTSSPDLLDLADSLAGFPSSISDQREFRLGRFGPEYAGGAVIIQFVVGDRSGHCNAVIRLESDHDLSQVESGVVVFRAEPADIDAFCAGLRRLALDKAGTVKLHARFEG